MKYPQVKRLLVTLVELTVLATLLSQHKYEVAAQGVKGGFSTGNSGSSSGIGFGTGGQSLSSSFMQMFSQLTPVQQQQFIKQMSSSNKRVFQQLVQPQTSFNAFEESSSFSGGGGGGQQTTGGTKSALSNFRQSSSQVLSPAQQNFFRSQQSKSFSSSAQPVIQPSSQFSQFSRQVSSQVQPTISIPSPSSNEFQSSKTIVNSIQPQPQPQQQTSFFNQVRQVQQVAQPVVLPSSEQSFRRVQSFSSTPVAPVQTESGFTQQIVQQQVQPQPVQSSSAFNRQFSSSFGAQPSSIEGFNQFSASSSSNLAGGGPTGGLQTFGLNDVSTGGFSGALQQEKVDSSSGFAGNEGSTVTGTPAQSSLQQQSFSQQQQSTPQIVTIPGSSSFESSSSSSGFGNGQSGFSTGGTGFDISNAQQKIVTVPDDFNGLTAASINNRWYIMKPVENPSALGLGSANGQNMRQVPLSKLIEASRSSSAQTSAITAAAASTSDATKPKKRSAATATTTAVNAEEVKPTAEAKPATEISTSSSSDSEEEESETRK